MRALTRVFGIGAALACLLAAAGCSRGANPSVASAPRAVHVVMRTTGETFEGVPVGERLAVRGTMSVWADPAASMRRTSYESVRAGEPAFRREELVRDGVWSIYNSAIDGSPAQAFQMDAAQADQHPPGPDGDPMRRANLGAYRAWVASGEATVTGSGEVSGTPTYHVRASSGTTVGGVVLDADVRRSDYVPVGMTGERWNLIRGKREIAETWSARYDVVEMLPPSSVPSGTFALEFPPGVVPYADFAVAPARAASFPLLHPRWLGPSFAGEAVADGKLRYRSRPPAEFGWAGTFPSPYEMAEARRPDFATQWMEAEYGASRARGHGAPPEAPDAVFVLTFPRVPRERWPSFHKGTSVATATVGGQRALRAVQTQTYGANGTVRSWVTTWIVLDLDDGTVVIEGIGATPAELDSAVRSLRRVGE